MVKDNGVVGREAVSIRELILFGEQGDPRALKTFSNVPYFLVKHLEDQGVIVHTVDLSIREVWQKIIRRLYDSVLHFFYRTAFSFQRSKWHNRINSYKIRTALARYPNADACMFTSFSFSAVDFTDKPTYLFCDWDHYDLFHYHLQRTPDQMEQQLVDREKGCIELARAVFVLFPGAAERMRKRYVQPHIFYLGNVVNNLEEPDVRLIKQKQESQILLFIGNYRYLEGFHDVLASFTKLKKKFPALTLHAIGISTSHVKQVPAGVYLHGYLDKDNPEQREKYYSLANSASVYVNTQPKWSAFSATLEMMYFYTPIIISSYEEFEITFGEQINFGFYHERNCDLSNEIESILTTPEYSQLGQNAHNAAKSHNWSSLVNEIRKKMEQTYAG
ncbi:MAG TPA: glycosyltransferase [Flavihumibacter sp.]|nr:glycosyltransferase [Flavihumibacter sp.]